MDYLYELKFLIVNKYVVQSCWLKTEANKLSTENLSEWMTMDVRENTVQWGQEK